MGLRPAIHSALGDRVRTRHSWLVYAPSDGLLLPWVDQFDAQERERSGDPANFLGQQVLLHRGDSLLDAFNDLIEGRSSQRLLVEVCGDEELLVDVGLFMDTAPQGIELMLLVSSGSCETTALRALGVAEVFGAETEMSQMFQRLGLEPLGSMRPSERAAGADTGMPWIVEQADVNLQPRSETPAVAIAHLQTADQNAAHPGRMIALIGAAESVGTTSLAISLATLEAEQAPEELDAPDDEPLPPLILDLDPYFGDLNLQSEVADGAHFLSLLRHTHRIDPQLLRRICQSTAQGYGILACQTDLDDDSLLLSEAADQLFAALRQTGAHVLVNVPRHERSVLRLALAESDVAVVVLDASPVGARDAIRIESLARKVNPQLAVVLVLSHSQAKPILTREQLQTALGRPADFELPHDAALFEAALSSAQPLVTVAKRSRTAQEITRLHAVLRDAEALSQWQQRHTKRNQRRRWPRWLGGSKDSDA